MLDNLKIYNIVKAISKEANFDYTDYDCSKFVYYNCNGDNLCGCNTYTINIFNKSSLSCFVDDNNYDIYEFSELEKEDKNQFLVLAHNLDFDYWLLLVMITNAKNSLNVKYDVVYRPIYNAGNIKFLNNKVIEVTQFLYERALCLGKNNQTKKFDYMCLRKLN